ncbi:serine/threonine protein kinase-like protein 4 [Sarcoptes scabiei]|uniref:Serine/threonine protein kinase-like protein 4 n=1 Tax=Sarcoptes scabiei TaxID=52283 RepID=A0A132A0Y4_SARSC|nr:serine/threonine protein kinase-like protein 4 [Sarcoptes scabiei]
MSKTTIKSKIVPASSSGLSLTHFKSSSNYLWNTNAVLGETVAVKCFNHLSQMRPYEVQKREFEVLKKVNHENIVKLLAIEEEVSLS